jgi:hypothetical protein
MKKFIILSCFAAFLLQNIAYGQAFIKKNIKITTGISTQLQDRRLFDFPNSDEILAREKSTHDVEFLLMASKKFYPDSRLNFSLGIGYSMFNSRFSRPFDHRYISGGFTKELRHVQHYLTHSGIFSISPSINIVNRKNHLLFVDLPLFSKISFNKYIKDQRSGSDTWREGKWIAQFNNFETFVGMGYQYKKIGIHYSYRLYNLQRIDKDVFLEGYYTNPDYWENKYEELNIKKFWLTLSYQIN